MEEKKLTNEKSMFNYIANDVLWQVKPLYLRKRIVIEIFDIIHQLQDENAEFEQKIADGELVSKDWHDEQVLHLQDENERLKKDYIELGLECRELWTKVDELTEKNEKLYEIGLNENTARFEDMKNIERLEDKTAELQKQVDEYKSKIEQGTLIEVKYPLYSDVYIIDYVDENGYSIDGATPTVRKCYVSFITQSLRDSFLYRVQPYDLPKAVEEGTITHIERWEIYSFSEKQVFLTREEAEKRLKELQE